MVDLGEDEEVFARFMTPLSAAFNHLKNALSDSNVNPQTPQSVELKQLVIGVARDLTGAAIAFNNRTSYLMLFEWYYPDNIKILGKALKIWAHDRDVSTPILKCMIELLQNRSQRLQFEVSSPNGILLFREASSMLVTYGQSILEITKNNILSQNMIYSHKLKGIGLCFKLLRSALCSNMANFGVFKLYNDKSLENAFETFVRLLTSISSSELADYPKLNCAYYNLMEIVTMDHMVLLAQLPSEVICSILRSITLGLSAWDTAVCTNCCTTLDHIVSFVWRVWNKQQKNLPFQNWEYQAGSQFLSVLEGNSELLQQPLMTIFNIIMFEDCKNQWSMSRPLLGLILINHDSFGKVQENLCSQQPQEKQAQLSKCFENLMEGIEKNLHSKNRDRFTHGLSIFRREVNDVLKSTARPDDQDPSRGQNGGMETHNLSQLPSWA
jgi:exportin-7